MALIMNLNKTTEAIILEVEKLDEIEQKSVLAYLHALNIKKKKRPLIAKPDLDVKPLSMAQIDKIKHHTRKQQYANK